MPTSHGRANRFWPALHRAGITPWLVDASSGMSERDTAMMLERGLGITNVVEVATARADELTAEQYRAGGRRLEALVRERPPAVVAVLGLTAYRAAFGRPAAPGRQDEPLAGAELWVFAQPERAERPRDTRLVGRGVSARRRRRGCGDLTRARAGGQPGAAIAARNRLRVHDAPRGTR